VIKPVMSMHATEETYYKSLADYYKSRSILMEAQYTRDVDELHLALKDLYNSHAGVPKSCGHEYFCVCPSDSAKKLIEKYDD